MHNYFIDPVVTEVCEWGCDDVCWWLGELGLKEYNDIIHSNSITGPVLLELQIKDFQVTRFPISHVTYAIIPCTHAHIYSHSPMSHTTIFPCACVSFLFSHVSCCRIPILQDLGITKGGHLAKLRSGIQALSPSLYARSGATKRPKRLRETR